MGDGPGQEAEHQRGHDAQGDGCADGGLQLDRGAVAVGDGPLTPELQPLVAATREAMTNAAKHAGVPRVDVYAEVTADAAEVFVRDRGSGFDPDQVPEDRHGVRGSIRARMERHGGSAELRTGPGEGTEVRLRMPCGAVRESE